jgi:hypothetical protein
VRAAFIINARNKVKYVARAVAGALSQTYPCHIYLSDQHSEDGTYEEMQRVVDAHAASVEPSRHTVELLHCPVNGAYGMRSCNQHLQWLIEQAREEWIFQCSADDYSLPDRVRVCMQAVDKHECVGVGTTMRFEDPANPVHTAVSGYPTEDGYVSAGIGIVKMAYGSTIWAYRRDWLLKVGLDVPCTSDVYLGYLASLDKGYYVVANPQHVHHMAADLENMGFQGRMRAAEALGDKATIHRVNELNRFQLFELYLKTAERANALYPMAHKTDRDALTQMLLNQAVGWYAERANLHAHRIIPDILQ